MLTLNVWIKTYSHASRTGHSNFKDQYSLSMVKWKQNAGLVQQASCVMVLSHVVWKGFLEAHRIYLKYSNTSTDITRTILFLSFMAEQVKALHSMSDCLIKYLFTDQSVVHNYLYKYTDIRRDCISLTYLPQYQKLISDFELLCRYYVNGNSCIWRDIQTYPSLLIEHINRL